ncbi:unnamed protein product [Arabis nemorensis]|uniref:Uncharacterized protein n=1 Tax=Arabis nemorensis TaxID=586526 RepID=A0A565BKJ3_9BRAS|nr:unnamed protein product [Arabis nemorensis]
MRVLQWVWCVVELVVATGFGGQSWLGLSLSLPRFAGVGERGIRIALVRLVILMEVCCGDIY